MQSFIKIGERVLEKTCHMIQTLCNFNKDKKSCVNVIPQNSKLGSRNLLDASLWTFSFVASYMYLEMCNYAVFSLLQIEFCILYMQNYTYIYVFIHPSWRHGYLLVFQLKHICNFLHYHENPEHLWSNCWSRFSN